MHWVRSMDLRCHLAPSRLSLRFDRATRGCGLDWMGRVESSGPGDYVMAESMTAGVCEED